MGGGGCDWQFPEGIDGDPVFIDFLATSGFTVPSGKNLYIASASQFFSVHTTGCILRNCLIQKPEKVPQIMLERGVIVAHEKSACYKNINYMLESLLDDTLAEPTNSLINHFGTRFYHIEARVHDLEVQRDRVNDLIDDSPKLSLSYYLCIYYYVFLNC